MSSFLTKAKWTSLTIINRINSYIKNLSETKWTFAQVTYAILRGKVKIIENGETTWTSRKLCNSCKRENEHNPT